MPPPLEASAPAALEAAGAPSRPVDGVALSAAAAPPSDVDADAEAPGAAAPVGETEPGALAGEEDGETPAGSDAVADVDAEAPRESEAVAVAVCVDEPEGGR